MPSNNRLTLPASSSLPPEGGGEEGNALVEFIMLGTLLMIPTLYFLLSVFSLQSAAFAASNASSQALQYLQQVPEGQASSQVAAQVAQLAGQDFGIPAEDISTRLICAASCARGERMEVQVTVTAHLPLIPWVVSPSLATLESRAVAWGGNYS